MGNPDFLIIGAQKCGTTNFWWILNQHPDICMSKNKELHYFLRHTNYPDHDWYRSNFVDDGRVTGESTPSYCFWPGAIEKIHTFNPETKLIMLLRNPVHRAISQYWMEFGAGHEELSIGNALWPMDTRQASEFYSTWHRTLYHHSYLARGIYHIQIDRVLEFFPEEQLHIQVLEDFMVAPTSVMWEVAKFLGVNPDWEFDPYSRQKKGDYPPTPTNVVKRLAIFFQTPNELLRRKYKVMTEIWEE